LFNLINLLINVKSLLRVNNNYKIIFKQIKINCVKSKYEILKL